MEENKYPSIFNKSTTCTNYVNRKNWRNVLCKSKNYGDFTILDYVSWDKVVVKFTDTGFVKTCSMKEVRTGSVKDYLKPSVYGVGYLGSNIKVSTLDYNGKKKAVKTYELWCSMLNRVYGKRKLVRYKDCKVSENFKNYTYFKLWCENQIGYNKIGFDLDKDLLSSGIYSEDTCVFIPIEINSSLTKREVGRGDCLIGVYRNKRTNKFVSQVNTNNGSQNFLGCFSTEGEAFQAYKFSKENYMKFLAEKWRDQIDPRAYEALMNYEVNITD